jgi:hypothetical protein
MIVRPTPRRQPLTRLPVAAMLGALLVVLVAAPGPTDARLPTWTGGVDLYRSGTFTTQKTWLWCTAADVQIIRNTVDHASDHSRSSQRRYFSYMRRHNRYDIPVSDGVDPAGWAAGLRRFVDPRYRLVARGSFGSALKSAVRNLRLTNLPVGITVSHGNHAWVLTGFTATADPAVTRRFTVTSVRVVGPLWGLQNRSYGYDMRPDTKLTRRQLRGFFTPWHYAGVRMAWEGDWVSIQPMAGAQGSAAFGSTASGSTSPAKPAETPSVVASGATSGAPATSSSEPPARTVTAPPSASLDAAGMALVGADAQGTTQPSTPAGTPGSAGGLRDPTAFDLGLGLAAPMAVTVVAGAAGLWARSRHSGP